MIKPLTLVPHLRACFMSGLLILVFTFLFPTLVTAIPLAEYQKNLQHAITALDTLGQMDEDETPESYQRRLTQTIAAVLQVLPEKQAIETNESSYTIDNAWLVAKSHDLENAPEANRESIRIQLIERLKSIDERVSELEKARVANALSKDEANKKLAEILSRSEYDSRGRQSSALWKLVERFIRWVSQFLPQRSPIASSHGSPLTAIAQIVVVLLAAAVLLYVALKFFRHFRQRPRKAATKKRKEPRIVLGERLEPEASAVDLLADAEALARAGEIRAAIRKAYIALLVELGDRKVISLAQNKTNRDYLRAVSALPALYGNMTGLTDSFERHWYGFVESAPLDWQNFKAGYLAALRTND